MNINTHHLDTTRGLVLLLCLVTFPALATDRTGANSYTVFERAPTPEKLANILFPPDYGPVGRLRSVSRKPKQRQFGLIINFAFDSAEILPDSVPLLEAVGEMFGIDTVTDEVVVIEGHTDSIGSARYNQHLSEMRARSIKHYLVEHFGVNPQRLIAVGRGERDLYIVEEPRAAINRRASFRPAKK